MPLHKKMQADLSNDLNSLPFAEYISERRSE